MITLVVGVLFNLNIKLCSFIFIFKKFNKQKQSQTQVWNIVVNSYDTKKNFSSNIIIEVCLQIFCFQTYKFQKFKVAIKCVKNVFFGIKLRVSNQIVQQLFYDNSSKKIMTSR